MMQGRRGENRVRPFLLFARSLVSFSAAARLRRRRPALFVVGAAMLAAAACAPPKPSLRHPEARRITRQAPPLFRVRLETSKGAMLIEVRRDWAPHGADRFFNLVRGGYYDDTRFFRVVKGQWAQFGINGDPAVAALWRERTIPDDPPKQSNRRGTVAFAFAVPNGRTTQVFISLRDNSNLDAQGFAPFGEVVGGMDVADALSTEYGENAGGGIRAGRQQPIFDGGNAFLDRAFPRLDRLFRAVIIPR
jgi:peptidyl-prolyl cis-trans isomerase A (cyclophilin A)